MESIKYAEKQLNATMKTPIAYKEHPWSPIKYDVEDAMIQLRDFDDDEDKEVMESIAEAEKELGKQMKTPIAIKKNPWSPITYDIEDKVHVQLKDDDDIFGEEEAEDKQIMESIKYAEKQLNTKMKTPIAYKEHPWSPIKYDVEADLVQLDSSDKPGLDIRQPALKKYLKEVEHASANAPVEHPHLENFRPMTSTPAAAVSLSEKKSTHKHHHHAKQNKQTATVQAP